MRCLPRMLLCRRWRNMKSQRLSTAEALSTRRSAHRTLVALARWALAPSRVAQQNVGGLRATNACVPRAGALLAASVSSRRQPHAKRILVALAQLWVAIQNGAPRSV